MKSQLASMKAACSQEKTELRKELRSKQDSIDDLNAELQAKGNLVKDLRTELRKKRNESMRLQQTVEDQKEQLLAQQRRHQAAMSAQDRKEKTLQTQSDKKIADVTAKCTALESKLDALQTKCTDAERDRDNYKAASINLKIQYDTAMNECIDERVRHCQEVARLEAEHKSRKDILAKESAVARNERWRREALESKIESLEHDEVEHQKKTKTAVKNYMEADHERHELRETLQNHEGELQECRRLLATEQTARAQRDQDVDRLENALAMVNRQHDALQKEKNLALSKCHKQERRLQHTKKQAAHGRVSKSLRHKANTILRFVGSQAAFVAATAPNPTSYYPPTAVAASQMQMQAALNYAQPSSGYAQTFHQGSSVNHSVPVMGSSLQYPNYTPQRNSFQSSGASTAFHSAQGGFHFNNNQNTAPASTTLHNNSMECLMTEDSPGEQNMSNNPVMTGASGSGVSVSNPVFGSTSFPANQPSNATHGANSSSPFGSLASNPSSSFGTSPSPFGSLASNSSSSFGNSSSPFASLASTPSSSFGNSPSPFGSSAGKSSPLGTGNSHPSFGSQPTNTPSSFGSSSAFNGQSGIGFGAQSQQAPSSFPPLSINHHGNAHLQKQNPSPLERLDAKFKQQPASNTFQIPTQIPGKSRPGTFGTQQSSNAQQNTPTKSSHLSQVTSASDLDSEGTERANKALEGQTTVLQKAVEDASDEYYLMVDPNLDYEMLVANLVDGVPDASQRLDVVERA